MVEDGLTDLDETLRERITLLKLDRDRAKTALDRIKARSPASKIDPELIERFGRVMRENITNGGIPFCSPCQEVPRRDGPAFCRPDTQRRLAPEPAFDLRG